MASNEAVALPVAKAYPATWSQNLAKYTLQMMMDKGKCVGPEQKGEVPVYAVLK